MIRFMSYNLLNYGWSDAPDERARRERIHQVIRDAAPDVLAIQEIHPSGEDQQEEAVRLVHELADATGLNCQLPNGQTSVALGNTTYAVAVLWRPGLTPLAWEARSGVQFWHSLGQLTLDVGGAIVTHSSFHATPFGRSRRADEAERVVSILTRPDDHPPALIGGDWNSVFAERVPAQDSNSGQWQFYDADPYQSDPWYPDLIYQCDWDIDQHGKRHWRADRRPGEVLEAGGLKDPAVALGVPWAATTGHWPVGDPYGSRRIDAIKITDAVVPALEQSLVIRTAATLSASDHLPVVCDYAPERLSGDLHI